MTPPPDPRGPRTVARRSFVAVVTVSLVAGFFLEASAGIGGRDRTRVHGPLRVGDERGGMILDGDRDGDAVAFDHDHHAGMIGEVSSCRLCHHLSGSPDRVGGCSDCHARMHEHQPVFDHDRHLGMVAKRRGFSGPRAENRTCSLCHDHDRPRPDVDPGVCRRCHAEPGWEEVAGGRTMRGYVSALHRACVRCHGIREEGRVYGTKLGNCGTCHP